MLPLAVLLPLFKQTPPTELLPHLSSPLARQKQAENCVSVPVPSSPAYKKTDNTEKHI